MATFHLPHLKARSEADESHQRLHRRVVDFVMYRRRYVVGYSVIAFGVVWMLLTAALYIPGGLDAAEVQSTITASALTFWPLQPASIVNLPYYILQHTSFALFGVTTLSVKLPSLILAGLSAIGMLVLLHMWFRRSVAILTMIITLTTGQFLLIAQQGAPTIMYIFWPTWLVIATMMVARSGNARSDLLWKAALCTLVALSLYTPLSIYVVVALVAAALVHPHLRYITTRLPRTKVLVSLLWGLILTTPLLYSILTNPTIALQLLGIPSSLPTITTHVQQLFHLYFNFTSSSMGAYFAPIYGLGTTLIILMGVVRLFTTKYTGRSYIITIWLCTLLPILIINPLDTSITFIPVMLLMAMGVSLLMSNWYELFPRNPYARAAGLIPLSILVASLVLSGVDRYMYSYQYNPAVASNFSNDLSLLNTVLEKNSTKTVRIITAPEEESFYQSVAKYHDNVRVNTLDITAVTDDMRIVTHAAMKNTQPLAQPTRIITSGMTTNSDRFYIY